MPQLNVRLFPRSRGSCEECTHANAGPMANTNEIQSKSKKGDITQPIWVLMPLLN